MRRVAAFRAGWLGRTRAVGDGRNGGQALAFGRESFHTARQAYIHTASHTSVHTPIHIPMHTSIHTSVYQRADAGGAPATRAVAQSSTARSQVGANGLAAFAAVCGFLGVFIKSRPALLFFYINQLWSLSNVCTFFVMCAL